MREPIDDPAQQTFSTRRPRPKPMGSQAAWIVVALVGALVFVFLIRALLERTSGTIGGSVVRAPVEASDPDASNAAGAYEVSIAPTPAPESYPTTGMVYRCVGEGGAVSFQSDPCGPGERMTKAIHAPPEREPPRRVQHAAVAPSGNVGGQYARIPASDTGQDSNDFACAQARRNREETLERVGLARTYDLLQRLDAMVDEACN